MKKASDVFNFLFSERPKVTAATKKVQTMAEAPAVVSAVTALQLANEGHETVAEALSWLPGLYPIYDLITFNFGVRGISAGVRGGSSIMKVLIDGIPVGFRSDTTNLLGLSLIPLRAIDRIEVIRGPGSALYGANAYLGVINIVPRTGAQLNGGLLTFRYGTDFRNPDGGLGGDLVLGGSWKAFDILIAASGMYLNRSGLQVPDTSPAGKLGLVPDDRSRQDHAWPMSLFGRLSHSDIFGGTLSLTASMQVLDAAGEFQNWVALTHKNRVALHNTFIKAAYRKHFLKDKVSWQLYTLYGFGEPLEREYFDIPNPNSHMRRRLGYRTVEAGTEVTWSFLKKSAATIGVDSSLTDHDLLRYATVSNRDGAEVPKDFGAFSDTQRFLNFGAYLQGIFYPIARLGITGGFRFDYHSKYNEIFNGRLGVIFAITKKYVVKLLYGSSFKAPSAIQLYAEAISLGDIIGNSTLEPQRAHTFEAQVLAKPIRWLELSLNGYYNMIFDHIQFITYGGYQKPTNMTDLHTVGAELEARVTWRDLQFVSTFSYQWTRDLKPRNVYPDRERLTGTSTVKEYFPMFMGTVGVNYYLRRAYLNFFAGLRVIGQRGASLSNIGLNRSTAYEFAPYAYGVVTVRTRGLKLWGKRETVFCLSLKNFANQRYADPGHGGIDLPGQGISLWVRATQHF